MARYTMGGLIALCAVACGKTAPEGTHTSTHDTTETTPREVPACAGSSALLYTSGAPSGFAQCADGRVHRESVAAVLPPATESVCSGDESTATCSADADCGVNGLCRNLSYYGERCDCWTACNTDADCGAGEACVGPGLFDTFADFGLCQQVGCRVDADCSSGLCVVSTYTTDCGPAVYLACQERGDACSTDADCADGTCDFDGSQWTCEDVECVVR